MVHDTSRCCQDDVAELTRWQQLDNPLLEIAELDVVSGGDDTGLVEAAVELDDDLAIAVVINFLILSDIACSDVLVHPCARLLYDCRGRINMGRHGNMRKHCVRSSDTSFFRALKGQRSSRNI
jgi:hypothetical protein